jgi:hypothetical protein
MGVASAGCTGGGAAPTLDAGSRASATPVPEGGTEDSGATKEAGYPVEAGHTAEAGATAPDPGVYGVIDDAGDCPADGGSTSGPGGGTAPCVCVTVDLSMFDRSCQTARDCMAIAAGVVCTNQCVASCGNAFVNVGDLPRYQQAIAPLSMQPPPLGCSCPDRATAACVGGRCVVQR